jgi:hypothetical protein
MAADDVERQLELLYEHADEAERLEHAAAVDASRDIRNRMEAVSHWLAQRWVRDFGALTVEADPARLELILRELRSKLAALQLDPTRVILLWGHRALALGVSQAADEIGVAVPLAGELGEDSLAAAAHAARAVDERLRRSQRLLTVIRGSKHDDVVPGLAAAHAAMSDVDRAARWVVNREVNHGSHQVAETLFTDLMWVAERDACVVCLALSGHVATYGNYFDEHATFGTKPAMTVWPPGELNRPPRHWACRCRVTPFIGHDTEGALTASIPGWHKGQASASEALSESLKREARRSILKGWSLESESEAVRLAAADRLLKRGANLPKTVEQEARKAVNAGRFKSRDVPSTVSTLKK